MSNYAVEGRGLEVLYDGRRVLDVPEISVYKGETLAVMGPNGAGKSTLLRVLGLLERPARGEILLNGERANGNSNLLALRRRFASVFQDALLVDGTVERNVGLGLQLRGMPRSEIRERTTRWMRRLGIEALASRQVRDLSGGEAQRVSLARAFAIEPDILLLDEPFSALDPLTRESLFRDFQRVLRESRVTTIFVTHGRREAMRLGDRVAVMIDGRCEQVGTPEEVFSHPVSEAVARFMGMENFFAGHVTGEQDGLLTVQTKQSLILTQGKAPVGASVLVCIRPEDLMLQRRGTPESHSEAANHLSGRVTDLLLAGLHYRVEVDCGDRLTALVSKHSLQDLPLEISSDVCVRFHPSAAHVVIRQSQAEVCDSRLATLA